MKYQVKMLHISHIRQTHLDSKPESRPVTPVSTSSAQSVESNSENPMNIVTQKKPFVPNNPRKESGNKTNRLSYSSSTFPNSNQRYPELFAFIPLRTVTSIGVMKDNGTKHEVKLIRRQEGWVGGQVNVYTQKVKDHRLTMRVGWVVKNGQKYVYVVVECPL